MAGFRILTPSSDSIGGWLSPNSALKLSLAALVIENVVEIPLGISSPCEFFDMVKGKASVAGCGGAAGLVKLLSVAVLTWCLAVLTYDWVAKCAAIIKVRGDSFGESWFARGLGSLSGVAVTNRWVVGSTRSFFLETASAVTSSRALAVLALLPAVAATLLRIVPVVNVYSIATTGDASGRRVVPLLCLDDELLSFGCTAHIWRRVLLQTSWTIMLTMVAPVLGVPSVMWSPVAQAAAERYKDVSLLRMIRLPWLLCPLIAVNMFTGLAYFYVLWEDDETHFVIFREVVLCLTLLGIVYGMGLLLWSRLLQDATKEIGSSKLLAKLKDWLPCCKASGMYSRFHSAAASSDEQSLHDVSCRGLPQSEVASLRTPSVAVPQRLAQPMTQFRTFKSENGVARDGRVDKSKYHQQLVVLYVAIYLFVSSDGVDIYAYIGMYIARAIAIMLLFRTKDTPCDMEDLVLHGAGLGMLMCTKHFSKAAKLYLKGGGVLYNDEIPTYKATVLRMHRTLAVSYRWMEDRQICLTEDVSINMSDFQMQTVVEAIRTTNCRYVWIDKIAVPQVKSELQNKLLSRMLAVYSGAHTTLAIRAAVEDRRNRYHNRTWTAQEFCCASRLLVVTEPLEASTTKCAVTDEEEQYFLELRDKVQRDLMRCEPYWLRDRACPLFSSQQAEQIIQAYRQLASRTLCSKDEDKLRALCPMLSNIPVENHEELLTLVNAISATAPRDSLDNAAMSALTTKVRYSFVDITSGARARRRQSISIADGKSMRKRAQQNVRRHVQQVRDRVSKRSSIDRIYEGVTALGEPQEAGRQGDPAHTPVLEDIASRASSNEALAPLDGYGIIVPHPHTMRTGSQPLPLPHGMWQDMTLPGARRQPSQASLASAQDAPSHPFAVNILAIAASNELPV